MRALRALPWLTADDVTAVTGPLSEDVLNLQEEEIKMAQTPTASSSPRHVTEPACPTARNECWKVQCCFNYVKELCETRVEVAVLGSPSFRPPGFCGRKATLIELNVHRDHKDY